MVHADRGKECHHLPCYSCYKAYEKYQSISLVLVPFGCCLSLAEHKKLVIHLLNIIFPHLKSHEVAFGPYFLLFLLSLLSMLGMHLTDANQLPLVLKQH